MDDKFKVGKKWFWLIILASIVFFPLGIIFGIVLLLERDHRREGIITLIVTVLSFFILNFIAGYLIQTRVIKIPGYPEFNYEFPIESLE